MIDEYYDNDECDRWMMNVIDECDDEIMWIPFLKKSSLCKKPTSKADENNGVLIFIRKYGILKFK